MTDENRQKLFVIDTMARLLAHLSANEDSEVGDREIIYSLIAKEIQDKSAELLKT
jgi:hypothetical protein